MANSIRGTGDPVGDRLEITITARARHAALWSIVKKFGNQRKAADAIGVHQAIFGKWLNLLAVPRFDKRDPAWVAEFERKLFDLTGQTLEEIFPLELRGRRNVRGLPAAIELTRSVPVVSLLEGHSRQLLVESHVREIEDRDESLVDRAAFDKAMKRLSERQRIVLKARYGLDGGDGATLKQVAKDLNVTVERARQIVLRAERMLTAYARRYRGLPVVGDVVDGEFSTPQAG